MRSFLVKSHFYLATSIRHFSCPSPFDPVTFSAHRSCTYTTPVSNSPPLFIPLASLAHRSRTYATPFSYFISLFISLVPLSPLYVQAVVSRLNTARCI